MPESFHPQYGRILQMYNEANAVILIPKIKKSLHGCTLSKSIASLSYLFICFFTYTCVCILIQALDKSLQRRTYYHFSIKLDFIFLGKNTITPLIMLTCWFHNMNACNCNVRDEKNPNKIGYMKYDVWIFVTTTWIKPGIHIFIAYGFSTHSTVESHIFEICVNVRHCSPKISYNCLCKCVTKIETFVLLSIETKRFMFEYP